ncbi:tetratricopeptide repeat protein [Sphingomonas fuzhouensis]|uniref:tetratricopeptide repeat protein n=1 Tax=Sphingomonas fuzhouensis TaxID=3106033 RepID=UPI002AFE9AD0|nr:hypothetical protein [Sphingomonas sp. SGZ-02]
MITDMVMARSSAIRPDRGDADGASHGAVWYLGWGTLLLALCYAVLRVGLGIVAAATSPSFALKIAPDNAEALVGMSTQAMASLTPDGIRRSADFARRAYLREPVSAAALRQIGFAVEADGGPDRARPLLRQATALSRRDFETQLWLIEDAVNRGDVAEALRHYDVALRTSKRAPQILFGPLTVATSDPALISPLAQTIARQPPWGNTFLLQAASTSNAPGNMVRLISMLLAAGYPVTPLAIQSLEGRLIQAGDYKDAWALFAAAFPSARRDTIRNPRFQDMVSEGLAFGWSFDVDGSATGVVIDDRNGRRLGYNAPVGTGGIVARQMLLLPPGTYRLSSTVVSNNHAGDSAPVWRLRCVGQNENLGAMPLPVVTGAPQHVHALVTVAGCPAQWLELVLSATDDPDGIAGAVSDIDLGRVR